jgi:CRISPR-associated protein (TIGR03986 family)
MDKKSVDTTAPYNFIPIENRVLSYCDDKNDISLSQAKFDMDKHTGTINYSVETMTPLHISDSGGDIFRNPNGVATIPGNTMRGLTRFNASIFSYASLVNETIEKRDIRNRRFYYREFASKDKKAKAHFNKVTGLKQKVEGKYRYSILLNVHAGYMRKSGSEYTITPSIQVNRTGDESSKFMSYKPIHEYELRSRKIKNVNYMYNEKMSKEDYKDKGKLRSQVNRKYAPYFCNTKYSIKNEKAVVDEKGAFEGMLTSSNYMNMKKHHYLIFKEDDLAKTINISKEQAAIYTQDLSYTKKLTENTMEVKGNFNYYALPKEGEVKPVFYIKDKTDVIFGFTPYLRLPAVGTIYDGLPTETTKFIGVDWTDALFGWMDYRSKVSFKDLNVVGNYSENKEEFKMVLGEPKASWYKGYIQQNKKYGLESYNTDQFKIRGRKYYWMKGELDRESIKKSVNSKKSKILSKFKAINKGIKFNGIIRYENLSSIELGLLIYSLKQGDTEGLFNIGKGKPYGFGQCRLTINHISEEDINNKYHSFSENYKKKSDGTAYINEFKNYIVEMTAVSNLNNLITYKAYINSRKPIDKRRSQYLDLKDFKKAERLPKSEEVITGKKTVNSSSNNINSRNKNNFKG